MTVLKDIMREGFIFAVQRRAPVSEAAHVMEANNVGIVAVLDGERLVGVCSERDVVRRVVNRGLDPLRTPVGEVMTRDLVVGTPTTTTSRRCARSTRRTSVISPSSTATAWCRCSRSATSCGSTWRA